MPRDLSIRLGRDVGKLTTAPPVTLAANDKIEVPVVIAEPRPRRAKLPEHVQAGRLDFTVGGHKGYVHVGFYPIGRPDALFLTMDKEGSTIAGLMDGVATLTSIGLQHGVPLTILVRKFEWVEFEPLWMTGDPDVAWPRFCLMTSSTNWACSTCPRPGPPTATTTNQRMGRPWARPKCPDAARDDPGRLRRGSRRREARHDPATCEPHRGIDCPMFAEFPVGQLHGDAPPCDNRGKMMIQSGASDRCGMCGNQEAAVEVASGQIDASEGRFKH
ncbi:TSCPD domain-containing protein [Singulisphaera acidiphila]|uniref:TSCPD domain-containing protein n=1 Tax=Singulisphaera acidiphila TaxID=466153 RepID=UPI00024713BE|nr:hypothetical protein [Singulisphaera acidiphila]